MTNERICNTYPEMDGKIVGLLKMSDEQVKLYAAQRILDLEAEVRRLKERYEPETLVENKHLYDYFEECNNHHCYDPTVIEKVPYCKHTGTSLTELPCSVCNICNCGDDRRFCCCESREAEQ